jgi:hypothetical protein
MFENLKKEQQTMRYFVIFASAFLVLACMSVATAQTPGTGLSEGTIPGLSTEYTVPGTTLEIGGGVAGPVGIYLDPGAGPWKKTLIDVINGSLNLIEHIQISLEPSGLPGPSWTDWDEQIMTPNWGWAAVPVPTVGLSDDGNVTGTISTKNINIPNDFVEFDFNPENNPAVLTVTKTLVYTGPGPVPGKATVVVEEYPTPEPGTIVLLTTGLLALGLGYIRRRK